MQSYNKYSFRFRLGDSKVKGQGYVQHLPSLDPQSQVKFIIWSNKSWDTTLKYRVLITRSNTVCEPSWNAVLGIRFIMDQKECDYYDKNFKRPPLTNFHEFIK